jgi:hypothetical protein
MPCRGFRANVVKLQLEQLCVGRRHRCDWSSIPDSSQSLVGALISRGLARRWLKSKCCRTVAGNRVYILDCQNARVEFRAILIS